MIEIGILCVFAFFAGFIDSIAGGGGLIQLPALFIFLPHLSVATLFGTNKFASIAGTSIASVQYARHIEINWKATLPATCAALVFSFLGARAVSIIDPKVMRPLVLFMLIAIALYTFIQKDFGTLHAPKLNTTKQYAISIATGVIDRFLRRVFRSRHGKFSYFRFHRDLRI